MKPFLLSVALLALAACVPQADAPASAAGAKPAVPAKAQPITAARAVTIFDKVCGATLAKDFAGAPAAMAAQGFGTASPLGTATVYSATEDASFQIKDGPGFGKTCSFVFATKDPVDVAMTELSQFGKLAATPFGIGTLYRGKPAIVLVEPAGGQGGLMYYGLKLLSERT